MATNIPSFQHYCAFAAGLVRLLHHAEALPAEVIALLETAENAAQRRDTATLKVIFDDVFIALDAISDGHAVDHFFHHDDDDAIVRAIDAIGDLYSRASVAGDAATAANDAAIEAEKAGVPSEQIFALRILTIGT